VVIASRKLERLQRAAKDMRTRIQNNGAGAPNLEVIKCNIREEKDVIFFLLLITVFFKIDLRAYFHFCRNLK
jgi:hypothetical protein